MLLRNNSRSENQNLTSTRKDRPKMSNPKGLDMTVQKFKNDNDPESQRTETSRTEVNTTLLCNNSRSENQNFTSTRKDRPKMSDPRLIQPINYPQLQIVADPMTVNTNNTKPNNNSIITTPSSDTRKAIFKRKRPPQLRDSSLSDLPI